jgi:hypothetical protein
MNLRMPVVITAVILILIVPGITQSVAAQASRFTVSDCVEYEVAGDVYEYCYEETYVVNARETPPDRFVGISHLSTTYTLRFNGVVIESGQYTSHFVAVNSGSAAQVDRFNGRRSFTATNPVTGESMDCSYSFIWVYTNGGGVAHEDDELVCD